MRFNIVLVCSRCGQHRGTIVRREKGKRRGYCRGCRAFLLGAIPESEAPHPSGAILGARTGWMKPRGSQSEKPSSDD
jgi:hypothetical protein